MVGLERLELSTSRLSGVRSSHLSYRPKLWIPVLEAEMSFRQGKQNFYEGSVLKYVT